jgi:hypothetical protein
VGRTVHRLVAVPGDRSGQFSTTGNSPHRALDGRKL